MGIVLKRLIDSLEDGFVVIRVNIKEDEYFGEAIVQAPNGTPSSWSYNKELEVWE